jgi:hypothetical protein
MTSSSVPAEAMSARSAVSKDMIPLAGSDALGAVPVGRRWVGPACPSTRPDPSMFTPWARMRTSSMTSPSAFTAGRSPTMIFVQRSAARVKAARWRAFSPPRKRTSMVNGEVVAASSSARPLSARAW